MNSPSFGITKYPQETAKPEEYEAKKQGKYVAH
jgi:hypothetical protein